MSRVLYWARSPRIAIGAALTFFIVLLTLAGPLFAPHGEYDIVGRPFTAEGSLFGTDYLGQDVLSRVLYGGRSVLLAAVLATVLGVVVGIAFGVVSAYLGGLFDEIAMRANDVLLAFPQILVALLVLSAVKTPSLWVIVAFVGLSHAPRVARVARGVALSWVTRDFISAAEAIGERKWRIVTTELGPNLTLPLLAEAGLRLTYSIGIIAGIGFLGFAANPGAADWGQMTNENRLGLLVQPWGVLAPVLLIALFTVGTNMMADGLGAYSTRRDA